jgi:hypothetical protein
VKTEGKKPFLKAGKVVGHRAHLLSQRTASKTKLPHKTEKQTAICNKTGTTEGVDGTHPAPEEEGRAKKQTPSTEIPVKKHSNKPPC